MEFELNTDLDLSFPTMYKKIEEMYLNDVEFTPEIVYTLSENVYRQELLVLFKLTEFDQQTINDSVVSLYEKIKDVSHIKILVEKLKEKYEDELISFMILFSYDYFYLFYTILKENELNNETLKTIINIGDFNV
jgi:hypothetical protein